jgi:MoxR-like ATPase
MAEESPSRSAYSIGPALSSILQEYQQARNELPFGGENHIAELFRSFKESVERSGPVVAHAHLKVVASYGKGNWATIPWLSILDRRETTSTQKGVYVVYLFSEAGDGVYLALAQGVTEFDTLHRKEAVRRLNRRADEARSQVPSLSEAGFDFSVGIDLRSKHPKARMYEASTIASKHYPLDSIPPDPDLISDLAKVLQAYDVLVSSRESLDAEPSKKIALLGTWNSILRDVDKVRLAIESNGAWASGWTFRLREGVRDELSKGFTLYVNGGKRQVVARARVAAVLCAPTPDGMANPWPDLQGSGEGASRFNESTNGGYRTWLKLEAIELVEPFAVDTLSLVEGLSTPTNVINQNAFGYVFERVITPWEVDDSGQVAGGQDSTPEPELDLDFSWLAAETLLPDNVLNGMIDSLRGNQPQLILAGPPGTSKTWVAQRLATYLTRGRKSAVRVVQFHPSYTYEAFIEGLRPVPGRSGVSFEVTPGVVLQVVRDMRVSGHLNDPNYPYVIIMDEANRANLPRVMGELLYLMEYRDQGISLQLSKDFRLPSNLIFIATMNTADRSVRSIDAAMRRRFDIFELGPDTDVLKQYLEANNVERAQYLLDGLSRLNEHLGNHLDRHHTIGHSFFMRPDMSPVVLQEVWKRKLLPLIEEYYYDQPDGMDPLSVDQLWPNYVE